jgi:hypothetical protein
VIEEFWRTRADPPFGAAAGLRKNTCGTGQMD